MNININTTYSCDPMKVKRFLREYDVIENKKQVSFFCFCYLGTDSLSWLVIQGTYRFVEQEHIVRCWLCGRNARAKDLWLLLLVNGVTDGMLTVSILARGKSSLAFVNVPFPKGANVKPPHM